MSRPSSSDPPPPDGSDSAGKEALERALRDKAFAPPRDLPPDAPEAGSGGLKESEDGVIEGTPEEIERHWY